MSNHLTTGQRALLEAALVRRQHELDRRLAQHHGGASRVEHAREILLQDDDDDGKQRDAERAVDLALSDLETQELGAVSVALKRMHEPGFGLCVDCGEAIAFDRLKVEPWALRCLSCATRHEGPQPTRARL